MYALGEQDVEERKTDESGQGKEMSPVKPWPPPSNDATKRKSRRISWRLWVTDNLAGLRNGQGPFRRNSIACILRFLIFIEHMFKVHSSKKFQTNWRRDL